jgi:hypothetical protein
MTHRNKYLVTTNALTGEIESVEQLGSAGELISVDPSTLLAAGFAARHDLDTIASAVEPGVFVSPELPHVSAAGSHRTAPGIFLSSELPIAQPDRLS